jgi:hypothetical protein
MASTTALLPRIKFFQVTLENCLLSTTELHALAHSL